MTVLQGSKANASLILCNGQEQTYGISRLSLILNISAISLLIFLKDDKAEYHTWKKGINANVIFNIIQMRY